MRICCAEGIYNLLCPFQPQSLALTRVMPRGCLWAGGCCAPAPKPENKAGKNISPAGNLALGQAGILQCFWWRLWVQHGDIFNCLSAIQQCLDGDARPLVLHRTAGATPGSSKGLVCWQIDGLGLCHISYLKSLCSISEIGSVLLLTFPSTHAPPPPPRYQALIWSCAQITRCFVFN